MDSIILTDENFELYAAKNYYLDRDYYTEDEFKDDLCSFKYIKRLLSRYKRNGVIKERLILNHIINLYNVFGDAATKMLFFKFPDLLSELSPFLVLLNRMPTGPFYIEDRLMYSSDILMDDTIINILRDNIINNNG